MPIGVVMPFKGQAGLEGRELETTIHFNILKKVPVTFKEVEVERLNLPFPPSRAYLMETGESKFVDGRYGSLILLFEEEKEEPELVAVSLLVARELGVEARFSRVGTNLQHNLLYLEGGRGFQAEGITFRVRLDEEHLIPIALASTLMVMMEEVREELEDQYEGLRDLLDEGDVKAMRRVLSLTVRYPVLLSMFSGLVFADLEYQKAFERVREMMELEETFRSVRELLNNLSNLVQGSLSLKAQMDGDKMLETMMEMQKEEKESSERLRWVRNLLAALSFIEAFNFGLELLSLRVEEVFSGLLFKGLALVIFLLLLYLIYLIIEERGGVKFEVE